jgi:dedicator of cytokinesis protein 3
MAYYRELAVLMPVVAGTPAAGSSTGSWPTGVRSGSRGATPTQEDQHVNGTRPTSPLADDRPVRQDKKRLSLAFLTKSVTGGDSDKPRASQDTSSRAPAPASEDTHDTQSIATTTRSRSKETSRSRLSLSFLRPSSPLEALPSFNSADHANGGPEKKRAASKSGRSDISDTSRKGSVKKRLSFMSIGKKSSEHSTKGRQTQSALVEE